MVAPPGKKWKYDINDKSNMNKMEKNKRDINREVAPFSGG